jgi:predicted MPP superfamily phosphohydrolase
MQKLILILIAGLILFFIDLYVYQAIKTVIENFSEEWKNLIFWLYWSWFLLNFCALGLVTIHLGNSRSIIKTYILSTLFIVFASTLIVVIFLIFDDSIRLVKYISGNWIGDPKLSFTSFGEISRVKILSEIGLVAAAIPLVSLTYGMVHGAFNFQVKKKVLKFQNLPVSFNGFRILHISDLHTGSFSSAKPLEKAVSLINKQEADIVFFTGDLVNNIATEVEPYIHVLGQIKSKMGVYSVLGNHDYGDYVSWKSSVAKVENLVHLKSLQARMGWHLLLNTHIKLERNNEKIAVLGIENWGAKAGFPKYGKMYKAHAGTENDPFKILLSHDPSHWDGEVIAKYPDIDLMLSGHTHGMQFGINLPGLKWSPVQYVYKQWSGLYKKGTQFLYVNVGLGFLGYPGRIGFLPEITVLELQKA